MSFNGIIMELKIKSLSSKKSDHLSIVNIYPYYLFFYNILYILVQIVCLNWKQIYLFIKLIIKVKVKLINLYI